MARPKTVFYPDWWVSVWPFFHWPLHQWGTPSPPTPLSNLCQEFAHTSSERFNCLWLTWSCCSWVMLQILCLQGPFSARSWPVLPAASSPVSLKSFFHTMKISWAFLHSAPFSLPPLPGLSLWSPLHHLCLLKTCPSSQSRSEYPFVLKSHKSPSQKWFLALFSLKHLVHSINMDIVRFCLDYSWSSLGAIPI